MKPRFSILGCTALIVISSSCLIAASAKDEVSNVRKIADTWRAEHRIIDLHQHIDYTEEHLARDIRIMDAAGLGIGVNLSGGVVTHKGDALSEFERNKALA